jgi:hypothetical protein
MIFAISALPMLTVPGWLAGFGPAFPVTGAVASLYRVLIARQPAAALWGTGGLVWLLPTAAAYLAAGILAPPRRADSQNPRDPRPLLSPGRSPGTQPSRRRGAAPGRSGMQFAALGDTVSTEQRTG